MWEVRPNIRNTGKEATEMAESKGRKTTQRARAKRDGLPANDDAKSGEIVYTAEYFRNNPAKRRALLNAPDGTPGKEVAQRVEAAAPLIADGVKFAKEWDKLHGRAVEVTRALAERLVSLRMLYPDKEGRPDLRGRNPEYREAASLIYEKAGFDTGKANTVQAAVRYHASPIVRERLREMAEGDEQRYLELCEYYGINPQSAVEQATARRKATSTRLPALRLPEDDAAVAWQGAVQYAHKALEAPGEIDPEKLSDDERESLRRELKTVRERVEETLEALGE